MKLRKGSKAAKAWGARMKRLRIGAPKVRVKRKRTRGVLAMVKRRRISRRSSSGLGGGKIMNGIFKPTGILNGVLVGAGAAEIADNVGIANAIPFGKYLIGWAVGGVAGIGGVVARDMVKGNLLGSVKSSVDY